MTNEKLTEREGLQQGKSAPRKKNRVLIVLAALGPGVVAAMAGNPRWARVVGYALHVNPEPGKIPCHRVVTKDGCLSNAFAFGGENMQRLLLSEEGVEFLEDGRIDMKKYLWDGSL